MDTKDLASLQNQVTNAAQINPHVRYVVTILINLINALIFIFISIIIKLKY